MSILWYNISVSDVVKNKILLFIPGYNCEKQIVRVLEKVQKSGVMKYIDEIIFVNNRSTDNSEHAVLEFKKKSNLPIHIFRNINNYNLGGSHKVAFDYAKKNNFDYVIVLHGDDQGDINDILPVLEDKSYLEHDCMLGARFIKGSKLIGYSKFRTFGNRVYNLLFSIVVHNRIYDLGSGLNMYSTKMLKNSFYKKFPDRLTFNYCMILAAHYYKHNIAFFPITWREEDQVSNVKMASQAFLVLKMLFRYAFHHDYIKTEFRDEIVKKYDYEEIE